MQNLSTKTFFGQRIQSYIKTKPLMNQNCDYMVKNEHNILNVEDNDVKMFTLLCKEIKILFKPFLSLIPHVQLNCNNFLLIRNIWYHVHPLIKVKN